MHFCLNWRGEPGVIRRRLYFPPNAVPDRGFGAPRIAMRTAIEQPQSVAPGEPWEKWVRPRQDWFDDLNEFNEMLRGLFCSKRRQPIDRVKQITAAVAKYYGVSVIDIVSKRRPLQIIRPRQVAMYLAKTMTLRSLPDLGRRFGGRDHTTVLYAVRKIEETIEQDTALANDVRKIRESLS